MLRDPGLRDDCWTRTIARGVSVIFGVVLSVGALPIASAQAAEPAPEAAPKSDSKPKDTRTERKRSPGGKKVIQLDDDEFEIFGKLEKPSAFYVLRRSSLEHDWARVDIRLTPLVLESVQDPLF
ncbi:MAG: hypothetical protein R3A51_02900 [Nannocystaceae bacterium]